MGPAKCPDCPYDRFVAELASPGMRERWAERVNVQWSWGRDGCAWFHLCQKCHLAEWPFWISGPTMLLIVLVGCGAVAPAGDGL